MIRLISSPVRRFSILQADFLFLAANGERVQTLRCTYVWNRDGNTSTRSSFPRPLPSVLVACDFPCCISYIRRKHVRKTRNSLQRGVCRVSSTLFTRYTHLYLDKLSRKFFLFEWETVCVALIFVDRVRTIIWCTISTVTPLLNGQSSKREKRVKPPRLHVENQIFIHPTPHYL